MPLVKQETLPLILAPLFKTPLYDLAFSNFLQSLRFIYIDNPDAFIRCILDRLQTNELGAVRRFLRAIQGEAFFFIFKRSRVYNSSLSQIKRVARL